MGKRRPTRRPWISASLLAALVCVFALSRWWTIEIGTWDHWQFTASADTHSDKGSGVRVRRGRIDVLRVHAQGIIFTSGSAPPYQPDPIVRARLYKNHQDLVGWHWGVGWYANQPRADRVVVPIWWLIAPLLAWTAWRWWRFKPLAPGECRRCRYDAAGLDACPECGEAIEP